jgi:histidyl-tRNA synthetase
VNEVAALAVRLRRAHRVEHAYAPRNPGKGLRDADRRGAVYAGLRGASERAGDEVQLKHLGSGEQTRVRVAELERFLQEVS